METLKQNVEEAQNLDLKHFALQIQEPDDAEMQLFLNENSKRGERDRSMRPR